METVIDFQKARAAVEMQKLGELEISERQADIVDDFVQQVAMAIKSSIIFGPAFELPQFSLNCRDDDLVIVLATLRQAFPMMQAGTNHLFDIISATLNGIATEIENHPT